MMTFQHLLAVATRHKSRRCVAMPRLQLYSSEEPAPLTAFVYEPVACLVLQGSKRTLIGPHVIDYRSGDCLVVTAELSARSQILTASSEVPYLAVSLDLNPYIISSLLLDTAFLNSPVHEKSFEVDRAGPMLIDAWGRALELYDRPNESEMIVRNIEHELLFRLLSGPHGAILRQMVRPETRLAQIRKTMAWIRERYSEPLKVEAMADFAGMSLSVFHKRFKTVAGVSPLEYQKHLRLHEARRRLVADQEEAATVAYSVGYESASQFSREYKRMFGLPPKQDAVAVKAAVYTPAL